MGHVKLEELNGRRESGIFQNMRALIDLIA